MAGHARGRAGERAGSPGGVAADGLGLDLRLRQPIETAPARGGRPGSCGRASPRRCPSAELIQSDRTASLTRITYVQNFRPTGSRRHWVRVAHMARSLARRGASTRWRS